MRSKRPSDLAELDESLQVGEEDVRALRRAATLTTLSFSDYLQRLTELTATVTARRRSTFPDCGDEMFEIL